MSMYWIAAILFDFNFQNDGHFFRDFQSIKTQFQTFGQLDQFQVIKTIIPFKASKLVKPITKKS
jgi:hypothetical protein